MIILKLMSAPGKMNDHTLLYVLTGLANTSLFLHKHPLQINYTIYTLNVTKFFEYWEDIVVTCLPASFLN
mgnify:CR=1